MKAKHYLVGGAVRDQLLGLKCKDWDYAVEAASYEIMVEDIRARGGEIFLEKPEFFTVRAKLDGKSADFVLCRKESGFTDGRHPDKVEIGTIYDDLARRDFTINAMAQAEDKSILDPFNGGEDLAKGRIRCVGNTEERLKEDYLRIMRAIRFAVTKGFALDGKLARAMDKPEIYEGLANVSRERIYEELRKCFEHSTMETMYMLNHFYRVRDFIFKDCEIKLLPKL